MFILFNCKKSGVLLEHMSLKKDISRVLYLLFLHNYVQIRLYLQLY